MQTTYQRVLGGSLTKHTSHNMGTQCNHAFRSTVCYPGYIVLIVSGKIADDQLAGFDRTRP